MVTALPLCLYMGYLNDRIKQHKIFINVCVWIGAVAIFLVFMFVWMGFDWGI